MGMIRVIKPFCFQFQVRIRVIELGFLFFFHFFLNKLELIYFKFFNKIDIRIIFCFLFIKNVTLKVKYFFK